MTCVIMSLAVVSITVGEISWFSKYVQGTRSESGNLVSYLLQIVLSFGGFGIPLATPLSGGRTRGQICRQSERNRDISRRAISTSETCGKSNLSIRNLVSIWCVEYPPFSTAWIVRFRLVTLFELDAHVTRVRIGRPTHRLSVQWNSGICCAVVPTD